MRKVSTLTAVVTVKVRGHDTGEEEFVRRLTDCIRRHLADGDYDSTLFGLDGDAIIVRVIGKLDETEWV